MNKIKHMDEWCARLIKEEGMRLMPYRCPLGRLTIGVGRCLETNPLTSAEAKALGDYMHGITENGAKMLLRNDVRRSYAALLKLVKNFKELTDDRQYALLDMCFQLGVQGLRQFQKMIEAVEQGRFSAAGAECLSSRYARQTPKRAKRVARALITGIWKNAL